MSSLVTYIPIVANAAFRALDAWTKYQEAQGMEVSPEDLSALRDLRKVKMAIAEELGNPLPGEAVGEEGE